MSISHKKMIDLHKDNNIDKWEWLADGEYLVVKKHRLNKITNISHHALINTIIGGLFTAAISYWLCALIFHFSAMNTYIIVPLIAMMGALISFAISYCYSEAYNVARMRVTWDYYADRESLDNIRRMPQVAARLNLLKAKHHDTNGSFEKEYYSLLSAAENSIEGSWYCDIFRNYYNNNVDDFFAAPKAYNRYKNNLLRSKNNPEVVEDKKDKRIVPGSEMDMLKKIVQEFPAANNLVKLAQYLDELNIVDYRNYQVIVDELTKHYYSIHMERSNGNNELALSMISKFTPLLNKSVIIANRMMDTINQAKLDQIEISNTFIGDKFHLSDNYLMEK